jgi:hypothetical protein
MRKTIFLIAALIMQQAILTGCTKRLVFYSKPYVKTDSSWQSYEECGYQCKPMADYFQGEDITIRIESFNYRTTFTIYTAFIAPKRIAVKINAEETYIRLPDGRVIFGKALTPGYTKSEFDRLVQLNMDYLTYLREAESLKGYQTLSLPWYKEDVYFQISFFFDVTPPPHPSEEFELHIGGLFKNGQQVKVPTITFKPAMRDSGDGVPLEK